MTKKLILSLALAGACAAPALAVPARPGLLTLTQPDGSTLQVRRVGDEFSHFLLSADGKLLTTNPATGFVEYARLSTQGRLLPSDVRAQDVALRSGGEPLVDFTPALAGDLQQARRAARPASAPRRILPQTGMGRFTSRFPRTGDVNVLVILVEYKDVKFNTTDPHAYFSALLNEPGFSQYNGAGSCADYFRDSSMGQFVPHFDLYGPYTLPQNRAFYGENNPDTDFDKAPEQMVIEACQGLDDEIDFSRYDNDGDGVVDNVYVFYAGQGEADYGPESAIWPHSWEIASGGYDVRLDGVRIDRYACSNEWESTRPVGIGTFTHEFSHVMGLPDLYTTDYNWDAYPLTPGSWDVLDTGCYNYGGRVPPAYSIYERNAMGWIEPIVLDGAADITLPAMAENNVGYIAQTGKDTEFFLFENRQQSGWDESLPGHGLLVWHIDFNQDIFDANAVNNTESHQYVDIEEACGRADNSDNDVMEGYAFPGPSGKTEFTSSTKPAFRTWASKGINLPITDIAESREGVITFKVCGGAVPLATPAPREVTRLGNDWFVAEWEPVEGATDYRVNLYAASHTEELTLHTADMGAGATPVLPEGWTYSANIVGYNSNGNYGKASPSLKMSVDEATLTTPTWTEDVLSLSFWCKGQNTEGSTLTINGLIDGAWKQLDMIEPLRNQGETFEVSSIPAGVKALQLVWNKASGNLAIDDIEVTCGASPSLLRTHESTSGATELMIEGLAPGNYHFTVAATDGDYVTAHSLPMAVTIAENGLLAPGATTPRAEYYDLLGRRILAPAPGSICIERRGAVVRRVIVR